MPEVRSKAGCPGQPIYTYRSAATSFHVQWEANVPWPRKPRYLPVRYVLISTLPTPDAQHT